MGYNNEKASFNQISSIDKYLSSFKNDIKNLYKKSKNNMNINSKDLKFKYILKKPKTQKEMVSFDGGIGKLFEGEIYEIIVFKVAGDTEKEESKLTFEENYFHLENGLLMWPKANETELKEVAKDIIRRFIKNPGVSKTLKFLKIDRKEYANSLLEFIVFKKGKNISDLIRETLEWSLIVNFHEENKNKDYVIVKDGSIFPSKKQVTAPLSVAIEKYLKENNIPLLGVVKSSRFVSSENSWSKVIREYAKIENNPFIFKLPEEFSKTIDSHVEKPTYERFFISILRGKNVLEIQVPIYLKKKEDIFDQLRSQISLNYGGSIVTNSYAHKKASLAEREMKVLERKIKGEINEN